MDQSRAVAKTADKSAVGTRVTDEPAAGAPAADEPAAGLLSVTDLAREDAAPRLVLTVLRLFRTMERVDAGLTPQQYRILKMAGAGGERSARLAKRLAVAKPTLTATADGLVAAGYARRDTEPGDRRVVRLCLTPAGHEALGRADAAYSSWLDRLLAVTSEADKTLVLDALDVLDAALDGPRCDPPDRT